MGLKEICLKKIELRLASSIYQNLKLGCLGILNVENRRRLQTPGGGGGGYLGRHVVTPGEGGRGLCGGILS